MEDRIREAKNNGLRNLPCHAFAENSAWLETLPAATDLVCWAKLLGFTDTPTLAHAEIATFRNLVLHVTARITRTARRIHLRLDHTVNHAHAIAEGWLRIRAAFTRPQHFCPCNRKDPGAADTPQVGSTNTPTNRSTPTKILQDQL